MPSKIILFDLDGTLANYDEALLRDLKAMESPGEAGLIEKYGIHEDGPAWLCHRIKLIRKQPGWWRDLDRLKIGFELLDEAIDIGFEVHVLTKGPKKSSNAWTEKFEWCQEHLPAAVNVTVTRDKSTTYGLALVDDYKPFLQGWLDHRSRGYGIQPVNPGTKLTDWHPRVVQYDGTAVQMSRARRVMRAVYSREPGEEAVLATG